MSQLENFVFQNWKNKLNYSEGNGAPSHTPSVTEFYYNKTDKTFHYYNLETWIDMGTSELPIYQDTATSKSYKIVIDDGVFYLEEV